MTYSLRILRAADRDIDEIAAYIAQDNIDAALRFLDAIDDALQSIRLHPKRYPLVEIDDDRLRGIRRRGVDGFARFLVFYALHGRTIDVIRVLHGARDIPSVLSE